MANMEDNKNKRREDKRNEQLLRDQEPDSEEKVLSDTKQFGIEQANALARKQYEIAQEIALVKKVHELLDKYKQPIIENKNLIIDLIIEQLGDDKDNPPFDPLMREVLNAGRALTSDGPYINEIKYTTFFDKSFDLLKLFLKKQEESRGGGKRPKRIKLKTRKSGPKSKVNLKVNSKFKSKLRKSVRKNR